MSGGFCLRGLTVRDATGQPMVADIDLAAGSGEAVTVIGETGSGKTLIALAMLGLLPNGFRASGTLSVPPLPTADLADQVGARRLWSHGTQFLPQEPRAALDPTMRVGHQLGEREDGMGAGAMLARVGLTGSVAYAYPYILSGGMAQRVLVAAALAATAPAIVVDEPTKGLDPDRVDEVVLLLKTLLRQGRSLLTITHDMTLARQLGGRVAVLRDRGIVECRDASDLFTDPRHDYTRAWVAADPARWPAPVQQGTGDVVLTAHGLAFGYGRGEQLFSGIGMTVRQGGIVAISGPSGSGKSTLLNVLVGLLPPLQGRVRWGDIDPHRDRAGRRQLRRRYQKLHQDPATVFVPHRTIRRQLHDLAAIVPRLCADTAIPPMLRRLGLAEALLDRYPSELSGGEAQRFAIARLLLLDPLLIIADEPTSRLDPIMQRETIDLLCDVLRDRGSGLVIVSHNERLISRLTDDVVLLKGVTASGRTALLRPSVPVQGTHRAAS